MVERQLGKMVVKLRCSNKRLATSKKNTVASTNEQRPTCEQATTSQLAHTDTHPITVEQERVCEQVAANVQDATAEQKVDERGKEVGSEMQRIEKLQAKLQLLKLQYELNEMEKMKNEKVKGANFADIEGAITKFTGDDEQSIVKWIKEYERVSSVLGCSATEQFLYARRMMAGSASLFMRSSQAKTWLEFKQELSAGFERVTGVKEALKALENRKWDRQNESLHRYTLIMQELAEGTPLSEAELVKYIIEGIRDKTLGATMSQNHSDLASIKRCIPKYERMLQERSKQRGPGLLEVRCYNYQKFGHYASTCRKENRPRGSCFKCGQLGHFRTNCPQQTIAAVDEEQEEDGIRWRMKVRVVLGSHCSGSKFCFLYSLIDTGSPCSFINEQVVRSLSPNTTVEEEKVSGFRSLDGGG
ncbi:methuselah-like 14 isoform X2 [Musca autumnalis]|uniref:methuselah-like 14 isoform X2 n=1 Tax=Musca autumnalis TaxID=221902 RepID=UPI003CF28111